MTNLAISNKNYEHVFNVRKAIRIKIFKDQHDIYLKVDVLLLACMFELLEKNL